MKPISTDPVVISTLTLVASQFLLESNVCGELSTQLPVKHPDGISRKALSDEDWRVHRLNQAAKSAVDLYERVQHQLTSRT